MVRPVPIPNTAVKHSLADGSGFIDSARVGRRQFLFEAEALRFGLFVGGRRGAFEMGGYAGGRRREESSGCTPARGLPGAASPSLSAWPMNSAGGRSGSWSLGFFGRP